MEAKDEQLKLIKKEPPSKPSSEVQPPKGKTVEEGGSPKSGKREGGKKSGADPAAKKIKGCDYAAWDKFDADKALVLGANF
jgi:hypothetical protein